MYQLESNAIKFIFRKQCKGVFWRFIQTTVQWSWKGYSSSTIFNFYGR